MKSKTYEYFIVFMLKKCGLWGVVIQNHNSVLNQTTHHNHENIMLLNNMMLMIIIAHVIIITIVLIMNDLFGKINIINL